MASRRGFTVYQRRDGRWVAQVDLGRVHGQRKRKAFYGSTREEVVSKMNDTWEEATIARLQSELSALTKKRTKR